MNASVSIGRGLPTGLSAAPKGETIERRIAAGSRAASDLQGFFRVQAGEVELYWQREGKGRRCFLGAFPPGAMLCAIDLGANFTLFSPAGASLADLNPETFSRGAFVEGADEWVQTIGKAAEGFVGQRPFTQAIGAGAIEISAGDAVIAATHPATANQLTDGIAHFNALLSGLIETLLDRAEAQATDRLKAADAAIQSDFFASTGKLVSVLRKPTKHRAPATNAFDFVVSEIAAKAPLRPKPDYEIPEIADYIEARGLRSRVVTLRENWWKEDHGDLICFHGFDRDPVVVKIDGRGHYRMFAPGAKPIRLTEFVASQLHPDALAIIAPLPNRALKPLDILILGARACKLEIASLATATLFATLIGLVLPITTGVVIDTFVPDHLRGGIFALGALLVVLMVCHGLLELTVDAAMLRIDGRFGAALQAGMLDRVMRLPSRFIKSQTSADLALRLMSIEQMRRLITGLILNSLLTGIFGLSSFVVLIAYSPVAALVALGLLIVLIGASILAGTAQIRAATMGEAMTANVASLTLQIFQNIVVLKSFGAEPRAFTRWAQNVAEMRRRGLRTRQASILFATFLAGFEGVALAVIIQALGWSLARETLPTGVLLAFFGTFQCLLGTTEGLARGIMQLTGALPTIRRAAALLAVAPESPATARLPKPLTGEIEFSGVSFTFPGASRRVLKDVTIKVERGRFTALVGPSGSGKSTLLNLLLGFEVPDAGSILYDGQDLSTLDKAAVRRQIGVVRQGGRLFAGTILENILGAHAHGGDLDAAWEAARLAGAEREIRAMPMGMHTVVTDGMASLSGGQVQRLLVARALAGKPKLLVLDEATSALDNITQRQVARNIEALGITRLVVAHRLSTVRNADKICFIKGGEVIQSGGFDELMRSDGAFTQFARRQLL